MGVAYHAPLANIRMWFVFGFGVHHPSLRSSIQFFRYAMCGLPVRGERAIPCSNQFGAVPSLSATGLLPHADVPLLPLGKTYGKFLPTTRCRTFGYVLGSLVTPGPI